MEAFYKLFWAKHLLVLLWLGFVFNLKDIRNLKMVAWRDLRRSMKRGEEDLGFSLGGRASVRKLEE